MRRIDKTPKTRRNRNSDVDVEDSATFFSFCFVLFRTPEYYSEERRFPPLHVLPLPLSGAHCRNTYVFPKRTSQKEIKRVVSFQQT